MKMPLSNSLWHTLSAVRDASNCLYGPGVAVALAELVNGSALCGRADELKDRSVLIATKDQLTTALALIELDGLARRIVLWPADLPVEHLPMVRESAEVDAIVSDQAPVGPGSQAGWVIPCTSQLVACKYDRRVLQRTEWVLLTSGTTGRPKLAVHTLASLAGAIERNNTLADAVVWATFYDIRRYGGLQIFLRAVLTGASLVLSGGQESTADFLARAGGHGVTHISGTPSHWRRALMSSWASMISPQYVRLSGEIADQAILSRLRAVYAHARIAHAFASTEAGLAFEVNDGYAGFPASFLERSSDVEMKVEDGSLRIRSTRIAARYIDGHNQTLKDADGFVDTGDMLELRGDRYYFVGRRDGMINVGGLKVHPEEVEAVINRHPRVRMSLVRTRKNPITGALVVADVVLGNESATPVGRTDEVQHEILQLCRGVLPRHKVPAAINIVPALTVDAAGKLARHHA